MHGYFELHNNQLTFSIPTELGRFRDVTTGYDLTSNKFCEEVPTEVAALSDLVDSGYAVITGNEIGSVCRGGTDFPSMVPTPGPTVVCEGGQYFDAEANTCVVCAMGRYTPQLANDTAYAPWPTSCSLCPVGKINQETGATYCVHCAEVRGGGGICGGKSVPDPSHPRASSQPPIARRVVTATQARLPGTRRRVSTAPRENSRQQLKWTPVSNVGLASSQGERSRRPPAPRARQARFQRGWL